MGPTHLRGVRDLTSEDSRKEKNGERNVTNEYSRKESASH